MSEPWELRRLGEVCTRTQTANPRNSPATEFTYVDVSSVSNLTFRIEETQRLLGKDAPSRARRQIGVDDVLFATIRPTLKRIAIVPPELDGAVCSTGYIVLRARKNQLHPRYLFHSLFSRPVSEAMATLQKGASYPAVSDADVRNQRIPVPPLGEQERVVRILDEALDGIAHAEAKTRASLAEALALRDACVDKVVAGLGEAWNARPLSDLAEFRNGANFSSSSKGATVPIVGVKDFRENFEVPTAELAHVRLEGELAKSAAIRPGDILAVRSNGSPELIGRMMLVRDLEKPTAHSGFTIRIRPKEMPPADPEFLCRLLRSRGLRRRMIDQGTGTNIKSLSQLVLGPLPIPFPPIEVQQRIAAELRDLEQATTCLVASIEAKRAAMVALRDSLLDRAFAGLL